MSRKGQKKRFILWQVLAHPLLLCAPGQAEEENLHRDDCTFPFWPPMTWKLAFCCASSHALDSISYVERGEKMKTGSLKPQEDDSVLCAAPGVAFVLEVVGGFVSATHDNGEKIIGPWKLRSIFLTVSGRDLWNSVNVNITRGRASSATVFLSCSSSERTAAGGRKIQEINLKFCCSIFIMEQKWQRNITGDTAIR